MHRAVSYRNRLTLDLAALCLLTAVAATAQEQVPNPRLDLPRARIGQPFDAPILVFGELGAGGGLAAAHKGPALAYGGGVIFRPGSAVNFLDFLYDWNCGLVIQAQKQELSATDNSLSADGIVRRYFGDRGSPRTEVRLFAGLGFGATRISEPDGVGSEKDWSGLVEVGQEWLVGRTWCLVLRGQGRMLLKSGHHHKVWQVSVGAGLPFPF